MSKLQKWKGLGETLRKSPRWAHSLLAKAHIQHDKQFLCQHTKSSDAGEADLFFTAPARSGQIIQIAEPEKAFDLGKLRLGSAVLMSIHYLK